MHSSASVRRAAACRFGVFALLASSPLLAQTAPTPAPGAAAAASEEPVLQLSPFQVVSDDRGYQASNTASVTVRDLARLGATVDAVVQAGANEISGIAFGLSNPQAAEDQARRAAVKALSAKAALYADVSGYRLVRLVNLSEEGGYTPPQPKLFAAARLAAAPAPTDVEPGELNVRITVAGVYELATR